MKPAAKPSTDAPTFAVPRSVAVIMDGNGRWAKQAGFERIRGHEKGTDAVRTTVTECARLGVEALTLYAFSEENWQRPKREVELLMTLLERFLVQERGTLMDNRVRLVHAGRRERLSPKTLALLDETIAFTAQNTGMTLCLAISYGGRQEITDAVRALARDVAAGRIAADAIDDRAISQRLYQPAQPDPDLLIRTSGEQRLSGFLLWQSVHSEFYFCDALWPAFRRVDFLRAMRSYAARERRYGA